MVIDLRLNGGGKFRLETRFIEALAEHPKIKAVCRSTVSSDATPFLGDYQRS